MTIGAAVKEKAIELVRRFVKVPIEARTGAVRHRLRHRRMLEDVPDLPEALDRIAARWELPEPPPGGAPVFVLSAGWRSGSTLLQRLLMSDPRLLVWGEPYDLSGHVQRLAEALLPLGPDWPPDRYFLRAHEASGRADHTREWIANLYPEVEHLRSAHRALFETLLARPARRRGYERWGFKEVRLSGDHALYLRWLFPDARILFLVRDPAAAYRSYRAYRPWYERWPDDPVLTARDFGRLWARLAGSFLRHSGPLGAPLLRYEDLVSGRKNVHELACSLDLRLDEEILGTRIRAWRPEGGAAERGGAGVRPADVPRVERRLLRDAVEPVASELGYDLAG